MKHLKALIILIFFLSVNIVRSQDMVIRNARIIDIEKGKVEKPKDIYILHGKIQKIRNHRAKVPYDSSIKTLDAKGRFLLPGFIESHAHISIGPVKLEFEDKKPVLTMDLLEELPELTLKLLLANGITTARDPGGLTTVTVGTKNKVKSGKSIGPELFVAGTILDNVGFKNLSTSVKTKEDIIREIDLQKKLGVDFIKLYSSLSPQQLEIGITHARKLGLKSVAHLHATSWTEAANLKIDNIVHIIPASEKLLPKEKRNEYSKYANLGSIAFYKWFEYVDLNGEEMEEMLDALKTNKVSLGPTLIPFHAAFFGDTGKYQNQEELKFLPTPLVENWKTVFNFNLGWTDESFKIAHKSWPKVQKLVRMLHEKGIPLTAGTDANNPWVVPGFSYHQELLLLKECGLSNQEVLEIAITNGAKMLGIDNSVGKIKKGYEANLVVLEENPLLDITHTRSIKQIIIKGQSYHQKDLLPEVN